MKSHIREALQAAAEHCGGDGAQTGELFPADLERSENIGAAQLLFHLANDVEKLDGDVARAFLRKISRDGESIKVFEDGRFAEQIVCAVDEPLGGADQAPWRPQSVTEMLRFVVAHSSKLKAAA
jgi:hypothetical protein